MADKAKASECKAKGNAALAKQDFDEAINWYTEAIAADPNDHVFYSNRSAAYLSKGSAQDALKDALKCVQIAPKWGKGYGRLGAAQYATGNLNGAVDAYTRGLEAEPSDALRDGLKEAKEALARQQARASASEEAGFPGGNPFGPNMFAKLSSNPQFLPYLADDAFRAKLQQLQRDPNAIQTAINIAIGQGPNGPADRDPRMLAVIQFLLGVSMGPGGDQDDEDDGMGAEPFAPPRGAAGPSQPVDVPGRGASSASSAASAKAAQQQKDEEMETAEQADDGLTPEQRKEKKEKRKQAVAKKEEGNTAYKSRQFEAALAAYRQAAELDPEDVTYLLNQAAVHFETANFDECIAVCKSAVEKGKEVRAPYATVAKAYARIGNALSKKGDLTAAIDAWESSLLEHRTEEVVAKVKAAKAEVKRLAEESYKDPVKAEEAKERGNEAFKTGDFPKAIAEYSEAIKRQPDNAKYWTNRAVAKAKLMDFGGSLDDAEKAIKLDPKSAKAWCKKGNAQFAVKEYHKAMDSYKLALELEATNEEAKDGLRRTIQKINSSQGGEVDSDRAARAMADPEIQAILKDPMVNNALEDIQRDPSAYRRIMTKEPAMAAKIQRLIAAGVLRTG